MMHRVIEFIWKYENAKEVVFYFSYSVGSENEEFVGSLKEKMKVYCSVIEKKGRKMNEVKFIFVKKGVVAN